MKTNVGNPDKIVRVLLAAIVAVLFLTHVISGLTGIILLILAGILVITSLVGVCPLYMLFGLRTNKKQ
jgi:hypothetical protein